MVSGTVAFFRLLHHFRGHKNVRWTFAERCAKMRKLTLLFSAQITCLYDMDLVDPVNFDSV